MDMFSFRLSTILLNRNGTDTFTAFAESIKPRDANTLGFISLLQMCVLTKSLITLVADCSSLSSPNLDFGVTVVLLLP